MHWRPNIVIKSFENSFKCRMRSILRTADACYKAERNCVCIFRIFKTICISFAQRKLQISDLNPSLILGNAMKEVCFRIFLFHFLFCQRGALQTDVLADSSCIFSAAQEIDWTKVLLLLLFAEKSTVFSSYCLSFTHTPPPPPFSPPPSLFPLPAVLYTRS